MRRGGGDRDSEEAGDGREGGRVEVSAKHKLGSEKPRGSGEVVPAVAEMPSTPASALSPHVAAVQDVLSHPMSADGLKLLITGVPVMLHWRKRRSHPYVMRLQLNERRIDESHVHFEAPYRWQGLSFYQNYKFPLMHITECRSYWDPDPDFFGQTGTDSMRERVRSSDRDRSCSLFFGKAAVNLTMLPEAFDVHQARGWRRGSGPGFESPSPRSPGATNFSQPALAKARERRMTEKAKRRRAAAAKTQADGGKDAERDGIRDATESANSGGDSSSSEEEEPEDEEAVVAALAVQAENDRDRFLRVFDCFEHLQLTFHHLPPRPRAMSRRHIADEQFKLQAAELPHKSRGLGQMATQAGKFRSRRHRGETMHDIVHGHENDHYFQSPVGLRVRSPSEGQTGTIEWLDSTHPHRWWAEVRVPVEPLHHRKRDSMLVHRLHELEREEELEASQHAGHFDNDDLTPVAESSSDDDDYDDEDMGEREYALAAQAARRALNEEKAEQQKKIRAQRALQGAHDLDVEEMGSPLSVISTHAAVARL